MVLQRECMGNPMYGSEAGGGKVPSLSQVSCLHPTSTAAELFPSFHLWQALTRMATDKSMAGSYSYISLFRTPVLRRISLCSGVVW